MIAALGGHVPAICATSADLDFGRLAEHGYPCLLDRDDFLSVGGAEPFG
jgi:hypothetical protein